MKLNLNDILVLSFLGVGIGISIFVEIKEYLKGKKEKNIKKKL